MIGKILKIYPKPANGSVVTENGPFECRLMGWTGSSHYDQEYCRSFYVVTVMQVWCLEVNMLLPAQPSWHSNGPFSAITEPFGINLSVFSTTNHLGNTLEPFVLHKNDRKYAN